MSLHPLAQDAVNEIVPLLPIDKVAEWFIKFFPAIEELNAVAKRSKRRKDAQDLIDSLDLPLMVGDISLFRLSVGALEWLEGYPQKWWAESKKPNFRLVELATVYAMAHRHKADYETLVSEKTARKTILSWARKTNQAEDVLIMAGSYLLPQNDAVASMIMGSGKGQDSESGTSIEAIGQRVAQLAGVSLFSALWEMPAETFWGLYCDWIDSEESELNATLQAQKKAKHIETFVVRQKIALIKLRRKLLQGTRDWLLSLSSGANEKG